MEKKKTGFISAYLPNDLLWLHTELQKIARAQRRTLSFVIIEACRAYVQKFKKEV